MNLRRMNANERTKMYVWFGMFIFMTFLLLAVLPSMLAEHSSKHPKKPLSEFTCEELYDASQAGTLKPGGKGSYYKPETIFIYYIENCYEEEDVRFSLYWACMDGCYNMEEILLGSLSESNMTQKKYHNDCAVECSNQYMGNAEASNGTR